MMGLMGGGGYAERARPRPPWARTLAAQAALCLALYAALRLCVLGGKPSRRPLDLYFLTVAGGARPDQEQARLLHQMEEAVRMYKAKFVVNIGELGDDDPLMKNGTLYFPLLKIPWFTTDVSRSKLARNFFKQIKLPHEQVLDIIGLDTGQFQVEQLNEAGSDLMRWMQRTLAATHSSWRIVVGFDPLIICIEDGSLETAKFHELVRHIFLKYELNVYMSLKTCTGHQYHDRSILYIGNPGYADKQMTHSLMDDHIVISETQNDFILHRVSPLEIESNFLDTAGKVVSKSVIHQPGRETMPFADDRSSDQRCGSSDGRPWRPLRYDFIGCLWRCFPQKDSEGFVWHRFILKALFGWEVRLVKDLFMCIYKSYVSCLAKL